MYNAGLVRRRQSVRDLHGDVNQLPGCQPPVLNKISQRFPINKFGNNEG